MPVGQLLVCCSLRPVGQRLTHSRVTCISVALPVGLGLGKDCVVLLLNGLGLMNSKLCHLVQAEAAAVLCLMKAV